MTIAIIGGGIAGLYAAWRLARSPHFASRTIRLFHDGERETIGGRLLSMACDDTGAMLNVGAGRISPTHHHRANALIRHLGIPIAPFHFPTDLWVLNRARQRREDLLGQRIRHPTVDDRLQHRAPLDWVEAAYETMAPLDDTAVSFTAWMEGLIGASHVPVLRDLHGYGILSNPELPLSEARRILQQHPETQHGDAWIEPAGGFQSIAMALMRELAGLGVEVSERHQLIGVEGDGTGAAYRTTFLTPDGTTQIATDRLILAVPPAALADMAIALSPQAREALGSVAPVPLFKMFVSFDAEWWREAGFDVGACVRTDLPLQKVYFRADGRILVYCDSAAALHWQKAVEEDAQHPGTLARTVATQLAALSGLLEERIRIKRIHSKFWPCGVHFWCVGAQPEVVHDLLLGDPAIGLHICGEAYSPNSGWIEGSLASVDALLNRLEG